jgi:hypothetical protein
MPDAIEPTWAIVELMGHVRLAGRLSEEEKFGAKLGRLDIPTERPCDACAGSGQTAFMVSTPCAGCNGAKVERGFMTTYFGGASVYKITIVAEDVARTVARTTAPAPVSAWDFPKRPPALTQGYSGDDDDDREDD